jgi:hypothetical protein
MSKTNSSKTKSINLKPNGEKFLVTFDIPEGMNAVRLYRELDRIATEGDFERIGGSVYLVNSDQAQIRAHTLAEIASRFGAGPVGESGGPTIWKLDRETPSNYFANRELAKKIADELLIDHRLRANKKSHRSIPVLVAELTLKEIG